MKINNASKGLIIVGAASVIALAAIIVSLEPTIGSMPATTSQGSFGSLNEPRIASTAAPNNTDQRVVAVGGGNMTVAINQFSPSIVQIQPGQSVSFYAPSGSTELHNVVIDMSGGGALSSIELAYILPSGFSPDTLELAPPDNIGEPIIQNTSDGRQTILALNKVLFHPSAVNQDGDASFLREDELIQQMEQGAQQGLFMPPSLSVNYTIQQTDVLVSSGLMLDVEGFAPLTQEQGGPQQLEGESQQQQQGPTPQEAEEFLPPAYPILSNFTVTFNEPGQYPFFCAFHPGMTGIVNVADIGATQNPAPT